VHEPYATLLFVWHKPGQFLQKCAFMAQPEL